MRWSAALLIYRLLLPLLFLAAFPGWIVKMLKRGGFGTGLGERLAIYTADLEFEPNGAVHVHAVSVGESLLALKLIREWLLKDPDQRFVLATGTATGHAVATAAALPAVRVTYSPLDFPSMVGRYLKRFEPAKIILIEGEAWPHLLLAAAKKQIPVSLVNARMSPRSARRYRKFAAWIRPCFATLGAVAIQEEEDRAIWADLGVPQENIYLTGSLKFDPEGDSLPMKRHEFQEMIDAFGTRKPIILAASTHAGEELEIASAIRDALPESLLIIVPRHAERRAAVMQDLQQAGFHGILRSDFQTPGSCGNLMPVLIVDSTGELKDWTAHADVVIIGKSFLATGGQNPAEAILAGKPLIFGPHMENFEPLASRLVAAGACIRVNDVAELGQAAITANGSSRADAMTAAASVLLARHQGATRRILELSSVRGHG
jgi:3-deoxy-D-manno-octulosonic-acid transferase